jgi:LPS-assembly protein
MRLGAFLLSLILLASPLSAQTRAIPATLIADDIRFSRATTTVTASGNVEIFYDGARLRAGRILYDGGTDRVTVEGPITLTEDSGRSIVFADFAELSADLQNGVLQSARLVLDRQLQIAATQINRVDGRYTQMYQTVASSCEVCAANPVPLWQIRARRIVHDQEERQLYFEDAQFRALGIPIAWFPRLRLPDPTLERATGFLTPTVRASNQLGTGIRLPYFVEMGDHADLTITPYVTAGDSQTLEARFRRAFENGFVELNGAVSWDDLSVDTSRSYVFADGWFNLPRDFRLDFTYETVSDPDYLLTYGYSEEDSLNTGISLSRADRNEYIGISVNGFRSLREGDNNFTLPTLMTDAEVIERFSPSWLGGIATVGMSTHSHARRSNADIDGRDVARLSFDANWRRDWILPAGVLAAVEAQWQGDVYNISQDSTYDDTITRSTPYLAAELRWPMARAGSAGVTHLLEPVLQYVWAPETQPDLPNEDGRVVEFDEGNLFSLNRFPGADGQELGPRLAYGLSYTRDDPLGWSLGVTVGQVIRERDYAQFTQGSGLEGTVSDFMLSTSLGVGNSLTVMNRALFSESFNINSNEFALMWQEDQFDLASSLTWLEADPAEGRPQDMAEWAFDASYEFDNAWAATVDWRYDFEASEPTRAGLSLIYATECVDVEFSLSRRFTTSATLPSATDIGLTVALNGFGASRDGRSYDRSCQR